MRTSDKPKQATAQPSGLERMLSDAARLATAVLDQDKRMPGLAIETVRAIVRQMAPGDAASILKPQPPKPTERDAGDDFDPATMIG